MSLFDALTKTSLRFRGHFKTNKLALTRPPPQALPPIPYFLILSYTTLLYDGSGVQWSPSRDAVGLFHGGRMQEHRPAMQSDRYSQQIHYYTFQTELADF